MTTSGTQFPTVDDMSFGARWRQESEITAVAPGFTAMTLVDPGRKLSDAEQDEIYRVLVPVTTASFGADMTEYWRGRRDDDYFGILAEFSVVVDDAAQIVGWTGFQRHEAPSGRSFYIDSTGMVPTVQTSGVMRTVFRTRITDRVAELTEGQPAFLSARSENPVFYRLMERTSGTGRVYPHPRETTPEDVLACARDLAQRLGQLDLFDPATHIVRNAYGNLAALYGELPTTGDAELDRFFSEQLGPLDGLLLVSRFS